MSDSEFIELLNLYLDHEITAADAARLESEVQASPERRNVYLQYCRMQKACMALAKDFAENSPAAEVECRKVVAFEPRGSSWATAAWIGGTLAAAAVVALVLTNRRAALVVASPGLAIAVPSASNTGKVTVIQGGLMMAAAPAPVVLRTVTIPPARKTELQPVLAARGLSLANQTAVEDPTLASDFAAKFDWIVGLQIAPMQPVRVEDLHFNTVSAPQTKSLIYGSPRRPEQGVVELSAFQFQK